MLTEAQLAGACRALFRKHRVTAFGGTFHVPATKEYSCLFSWDSGYHALALMHLDPEDAWAELRALFASNQTPDGLLAHERPLPGAEARTDLVVSWLGPIYRPDGRSWLIDPPVGAFAAACLYQPGDPVDLLEEATNSLAAIDHHRLLEPLGAPVILHPLESGADVSPLFDSLIDTSSRRSLLTHHRALSTHLDAIGYDLKVANAQGHEFIVSDPIFCGWQLLAIEALADAWRRAGRSDLATPLDARAATLSAAMVATMWNEGLGLFVGYDHVGGRQLDVPTLGGIIAAASRTMLDCGINDRVIDRHLTPGKSIFWGDAGISFNPLEGSPIDPKALLWRGDVAWGATQYWTYLVLKRGGRDDLAARVRKQTSRLIMQSGFREFYNAQSGEGYGAGKVGEGYGADWAGGFTWPALVMAMV